MSFSSRDVEEFWSRVASERYESANRAMGNVHTQRFRISIPRIALPRGGRLLNLWSRQGEAVPIIRERYPGIELVNAEISRVMLRQAGERFPGEVFVPTDLQQLCFQDASFNCVLSLEMLEHSPSPQRILREIFRVLKPGGRLILTCPGAMSEIHLWFADRWLDNHGEGPHRFHSVRRVKRMLREAGFILDYHRATLFVPAGVHSWAGAIDGICEKSLQWFPIRECGLRQLYEARKPGSGSGDMPGRNR